MGYEDAYVDNHVPFAIGKIEWEEDYENEIGKDPNPLGNPDFVEEAPDSLKETARKIQEETEEEFEEASEQINFRYTAPAISVDTAGRFVTHEIIGGDTVRQKIGEDPLEVDAGGICTQSNARRLDNLRDAKYGTVYSKRLPGGSVTVQFASISTSPMDDGGAVAIDDESGEFLYSYDISMVEVNI